MLVLSKVLKYWNWIINWFSNNEVCVNSACFRNYKINYTYFMQHLIHFPPNLLWYPILLLYIYRIRLYLMYVYKKINNFFVFDLKRLRYCFYYYCHILQCFAFCRAYKSPLFQKAFNWYYFFNESFLRTTVTVLMNGFWFIIIYVIQPQSPCSSRELLKFVLPNKESLSIFKWSDSSVEFGIFCHCFLIQRIFPVLTYLASVQP